MIRALLIAGVLAGVTARGELVMDEAREIAEAPSSGFERVAIGKKTVAAIMIEGSVGPGFSLGDQDILVANLKEAFGWLGSEAIKNGADLDLSLAKDERGGEVLTLRMEGFELPAGLPDDWGFWMGPVLEAAGRNLGLGLTDDVREFREALAKKEGSDGAYLFFVFPSGKFPGGWGAWASKDGYVIATWDLGGYSQIQQSLGWAHELLHVVTEDEVVDEYSTGSLEEDNLACMARSGYMKVRNGNQEIFDGSVCVTNEQNSIMRFSAADLAEAELNNYSAGMAGWGSDDGDLVPDLYGTATVRFLPSFKFLNTYKVQVGLNWRPWQGPLSREATTADGGEKGPNINGFTKVIYSIDGVKEMEAFDAKKAVEFVNFSVNLRPGEEITVCGYTKRPLNGNGIRAICESFRTPSGMRIFFPENL